ncbi:MAG TPA: PD-(D/E)XK nuclease family protein [Nitrospirae bacterium]|nr:PD-(D/E)XK nuclease family protein [Nitrospirota bacterium]
MRKGTVFIAPLGARDKKAGVFREIISLCPGGDYSSVLYITPSAFSQTEARRRFFSYLKPKHGKKVYIPFQSLTIKSLCTKLYETHKTEGIVPARIEAMVLCDILDERNIGYARLLSDLLSRIRHHILNRGLSQVADDVSSLIFEEKTLKQAVMAIQVLEEYEAGLRQRGLIDFGGAVKNSIPLIREHVSPAALVLDGFFDPTPLELEVIRALVEQADKVFAVVEETAEFLNFFGSPNVEIEKKRLKPFRRGTNTRYYAYSSMEDEVEGIARGVKGLILEGVRPKDTAVSFPLFSKYVPMLKRIFKKHGIPANITGYDLSASRQLVALEEMIASIEDDYPRNEFLSFLTSAHFPGIPETVRQRAVSFSSRAGIVKGKQAWLSVREILLNSSEEKLSEGEKKVLDEFQKQVSQVINTLEKLKREVNLSGFIDNLEKVLNKFRFFDSPGSPDDILGSIETTISELRHFAMLYSPDSISFADFVFYLRQMLQGFKGSDKKEDGVRVVPFELAAGLEPVELFFGGMIENDLPSRPPIDPILPEKVKKALGLPYLEYYLDRQKRHFQRLLNSSASDPYLSCPVADGEKIFLPSPFLDWEQGISPAVLNISTEEDVLLREGAFKRRDFSDVLWNGKLPSDINVKSALNKRFGPKAFFRVTDIDAYRKCPMRFYIEKFLGLEIQRPPEFEVEARLWGKLAHSTMEYLFRDGDVEPEDMGKKLFDGLEKSLREFPIGDFWAGVAREIFIKLLPALKEQEAEMRMQGFSPFIVEHPLKTEVDGLKRVSAKSRIDLRLKGKIDRVDIRTQSPEHRTQTKDKKQPDTVRLLDYKTGSADRDSLQLPLYISMWNKEHNELAEKAGFYSLKDGKIDWFPKRASMDEFLHSALQLAGELVEKMRKGVFKPAPFKDTECRYCAHSSLCKGVK